MQLIRCLVTALAFGTSLGLAQSAPRRPAATPAADTRADLEAAVGAASSIRNEDVQTIIGDYRAALLQEKADLFLRHLAPYAQVVLLPQLIDDPEDPRAQHMDRAAYDLFLRHALLRTDYLGVQLSDAEATFRDTRRRARISFTSREGATDQGVRLVAEILVTLDLVATPEGARIAHLTLAVQSVRPNATLESGQTTAPRAEPAP